MSTQSSAYRRQYLYKRYAGIPTSTVPAEPVRRHLQRLTNIGWTLSAIEPVTGISDYGMSLVLAGTHATVTRQTYSGVVRMAYTLAVPELVDGASFVPAESAVRRVRALLAMGWRRDDLDALMPTTNPAHLARGSYPVMKAYRWREVDAVFRELHMQRGPSTINAARCVGLGYVPPLGWTDIDDPDERPTGSRRKGGWTGVDLVVVERMLRLEPVPASTKAEKAEALRRWIANGGSQRAFCKAHGLKEGRYVAREAA